jgi:hypothetical protein
MTLRSQHTPAVPWPASPSLEDLGDPAWLDAYEAAGGHVRRTRSATGAQQAALVGPLVEPLSKPNPNFLRRLGQAIGADSASEATGLIKGREANEAPEKIGRPAPAVPGADQAALAPSQADEVLVAMQARATAWLSVFCPAVLEAMEGVRRAVLRDESESGAHAATSLRRGLRCVADFVEPAGEGARPDHTGTPRGVGAGQYKNRLYIYLGRKLGGDTRKLALVELELTEARLGALIGALGKAVHGESNHSDLEQLYLTCWSILARIAACAELPA